MVTRWLIGVCGLLAVLVAGGCGSSAPASEGAVPASAAMVPADATAYVTIVTDSGSEQWRRADRLLALIPGARDDLLAAVEEELAGEGLSWRDDIEPALGPEVVVVVTADRKPVVLTQPENVAKLDALVARGDEPSVRGEISGWAAIAERQADLDAFRAALERGSLDTNSEFVAALEELPADALARAWVDLSNLTGDIERLLEESGGTSFEIGLDSLSAALSAEEDGVLVAMGIRAPDGAFGTRYEPKLFRSVPADAVAALSFGGTQGALDRLADTVDLDQIADDFRETTGVSLQGVLDAFSGEGVLYVRPGSSIPEVTLVLAPPDPDEAFESVDTLVQGLADELGGTLERTMQEGLEVTQLVTDDATISYARLDEDSVIVTTGSTAIMSFLVDTPKLVGSGGFARAAEAVALGERTGGFVYVDFDGIVALIDDLAGSDTIPAEAREVLGALDSFILQSSGDEDETRVRGFLRVAG